ncbi:MAG: acetoacetate--CoA ligase [Rhodospirillales bacterium]|nr:acetoacetate--CoA ligase [Rhodospirillales bacterium]
MNSTEMPLWVPSPDRVKASRLYRFIQGIEEKTGRSFEGYEDFWQWSVENIEDFWACVWDFCGVIGDKGSEILMNGDKMPGAQFFPEARLNYAENLLRRRDGGTAIIFRDEKGDERTLTYGQLYDDVSRWRQALAGAGMKEGDRIALYLPNIPEALIAMLAASSMGVIVSLASPDFGVQGAVDRFGQIEPRILVAVDGYYYGGKDIDCTQKVQDVRMQLPSVEKTVMVPFLGKGAVADSVTVEDFIASYAPRDIAFTRVPFNHPLFIMFSSGTTGVPKCIVHGHGGTLLQHLKEFQLHCDLGRDDRVFYFTTTGWMMWQWLVGGLASEVCLLLFDGSPFHPDGEALWAFTSKHKAKLFGTSAKYIDALKVNDIRPGDKYDLSDLKIITSTGSPLVHESFDYVYDAIKGDVHLASISGGTDIVSCFVLGNPISPVWRGEIQGAGLGMAVDAFNDEGQPIPPGAGSGELVCTRPFPCMPVQFWNDPDGVKYHGAYFENYPNIWCHGDWIERTAHGGFIIHGRSDATLNPGGVRIGTAEIYRQVEQVPDVVESIAVGQDWDGDVRVILFVKIRDGAVLTEELIKTIKTRIRTGASPRHVPAKVIAVADIPRTKSNKIVELAVRNVIHGRPVKNVEALANPEALDLYKDLSALQD